MSTPNVFDVKELRAIQRKLDTWELEHLREHAAALHLQVEALCTQLDELKRELRSAEDFGEMWQQTAELLQDSPAANIGITRDGQVVAATPTSAIPVQDLVHFCTSASIVAGGYLPFERTPASGLGIEEVAQNDPFKRGVLVCLSDLMNFIRSRTGAEALQDLVLQPGGQQVEPSFEAAS